IKSGDVEIFGQATRLPAQLTTASMTVNAGAVAVAGVGGVVDLNVTGTLTAPSGGRHGGNGGGVINLTVGTLQLDGTLRARGEQRANPGVTEASGAGGTVVVHAGTIAGAGTIHASGEDY